MSTLDHSKQVVITNGLELRKIQELDEIGQSFKITVNVQLFWKDEFLTWNAKEYHGLSSIVFPYRKNIWIPDLLIYNALKKPGDFGMIDAFIRFYSNGQVFVWTQVNIDTYCEIKTKKYPYDEQRSGIMFAKFVSSDKIVTVQPRTSGVDLSFYVKVAEWEIRDYNATTNVIMCKATKHGTPVLSLFGQPRESNPQPRDYSLKSRALPPVGIQNTLKRHSRRWRVDERNALGRRGVMVAIFTIIHLILKKEKQTVAAR
ncbi:acetylcholine receptor subunit alpha-like [Mercenaria mercenaria]|uniref:acetylcholine receptor subunit alpha-like n=1 Tax=Mercenaria mercenaria TaxID=6596 RepID=UPI00234F8214|nr:acetylcholine receptor subunit alpha-like [Mercenaria mercenaria]